MNKNKHHKAIWATCAVLQLLIAGGNAHSQDRTQDRTQDRAADNWPARPVTLVVPYTPGTGADILARILGPRLGERWKQAVVTDNRAGASGNIGTDYVAKASPDGNTLLFTATSFGTNPAINKLPFDPVKSFSPVIQVSSSTMSLSINPAVPARNLREFVELAKKQPGKLHYASPGTGGPQHLAMELVKLETQTDMVHVPYKGSGGALSDLVGGHVQAMVVSVQTVAPYTQSGKLRMLALLSAERSPAFPDVPTFRELGINGLQVDTWYAVFAPAGTPAAVVARLNQEVVRALNKPEPKQRFLLAGVEMVGSTPEQLVAKIKSEVDRMGKVIKAAGIRDE